MKVIGHRGAAGLAPENTFAGFDLALGLGVDGIETDIQRTKDGQLVLFHADHLDKTTNGTGVLQETSWEELQQLDAGSWFDRRFEKNPSAQVGYLTADFSEENIRKVVKTQIQCFCPRAAKITKPLVDHWRSLGLFVRACGVSNTDMMKNAIQAGVDGMTFDFPDLLLKELGRA